MTFEEIVIKYKMLDPKKVNKYLTDGRISQKNKETFCKVYRKKFEIKHH